MVNIGIIIGIRTDSISEEKYPDWLKDIDDKTVNLSKEKWGDNCYGLGSDIAVAYYIYKYSKDKVTFLTKKDISLKIFNKYDYIIGLYEAYYYTHQTKDSLSYIKFNNIVKKSSAIFLQPLTLQKFILNKKLYMDTLKKYNIPVVDTISFKITDNMNIVNIINKIKTQCNKWGTTTFITKPQPGGFGIGFKKWSLEKLINNNKPFKNYIKKIEKQVRIEKPLLLVQDFVPEFERFYEIRTYWLNGIYSHSLGTMIDPKSLGVSGFEKVRYAYPKKEYDIKEFEGYDEIPDVIDDKLINKLKTIGKNVFNILPKDKPGVPFILRIDFGCCINNKNICRDYYINEIEYIPNLFPEYSTHIDITKKVGKAIIKKINNLKKNNK